MATSIYLAKLMGPVFLAVGIGLLVNAKTYASSPRNSWRAPR